MKLAVFGASGGTGTHVISQALNARHEVVAVVCEPARLRVAAHPNLDVTVAEVMDPAVIADLVAGRDAVISALGPSRRPEEKKIRTASLCSASAHSITATMRATGPPAAGGGGQRQRPVHHRGRAADAVRGQGDRAAGAQG